MVINKHNGVMAIHLSRNEVILLEAGATMLNESDGKTIQVKCFTKNLRIDEVENELNVLVEMLVSVTGISKDAAYRQVALHYFTQARVSL